MAISREGLFRRTIYLNIFTSAVHLIRFRLLFEGLTKQGNRQRPGTTLSFGIVIEPGSLSASTRGLVWV